MTYEKYACFVCVVIFDMKNIMIWWWYKNARKEYFERNCIKSLTLCLNIILFVTIYITIKIEM